jgi:hypothetical protein
MSTGRMPTLPLLDLSHKALIRLMSRALIEGAATVLNQKETDQRLESLNDRLSYKLPYRRLADHEGACL